MALPDHAKIIEDVSETGNYLIGSGEIHCMPFIVYGERYTQISVAHSRYHDRQHSSILCWWSKEPMGDHLWDLPVPRRHFHLNGHRYKFVFYPKSNDVVYDETSFVDADLGCQFDVEPREHTTITEREKFFKQANLYRFDEPGTYYLNIQNLVNRENGYYYLEQRSSFDDIVIDDFDDVQVIQTLEAEPYSQMT